MSITQTYSIYVFIFLFAISGLAQSSGKISVVQRSRSATAESLINFLGNQKGKHILSGQLCESDKLYKYFDRVEEITGKYPAIWSADFKLYGRVDYGRMLVNEAIRIFNAGYIIALCWTPGKPTDAPPLKAEYPDKIITTIYKISHRINLRRFRTYKNFPLLNSSRNNLLGLGLS